MTPRPSILWRAVAVTVTAGMALGATGCGNEGHTGPGYASKDTVVQEDAADAPLTRADFISATTKAVMESGSSHMVITMKGQGRVRAEGDVAYARGPSDMQMTMTMPQTGKRKIEMRFLDEKIFLQLPGLTPPGKFIAIDPRDQSSPLAKNFAGLADQMDPLASMGKMESATISVDRVGQGDVGGTPVDHYRMVVDSVKALKSLKEPVPQGMPKTLTYDLWLDDDNLLRRMSFKFAGTSVEIRLSRWGQPFAVERPVAGDIVKLPGV